MKKLTKHAVFPAALVMALCFFAAGLTACVSVEDARNQPTVVAYYIAEDIVTPEGSKADYSLFNTAKEAQVWLAQRQGDEWVPKHTPSVGEYALAEVDVDGWYKKSYSQAELGSIARIMAEKQHPVAVTLFVNGSERRHIFIVTNNKYDIFTLMRQDYVLQK